MVIFEPIKDRFDQCDCVIRYKKMYLKEFGVFKLGQERSGTCVTQPSGPWHFRGFNPPEYLLLNQLYY